MKIPFDIKYRPQIESGEYKVQTRDGRKVRILTFTYPSEHLIQAEIDKRCVLYNPNGTWWDDGTDSELDLFIITPEAEVTEFKIEVHEIISQVLSDKRIPYCREQFEKEAASALLMKAKKEICKGCTVGLEQYWKGYEGAKERFEKLKTFYYPTYEPPCFHGGVCTNPMKDCINCPRTGGDIGISTTSETCKKD